MGLDHPASQREGSTVQKPDADALQTTPAHTTEPFNPAPNPRLGTDLSHALLSQ